MNTQNTQNQNHDGILETKTQAPVHPGSAIHPSNHPTIQKPIDPVPSSRSPQPLFSPLPHVKSPHRPRGKVAQLPKAVRTIVNSMLDDGCTYSTIVRRLAELGHPGITIHNTSRWRKGGYEDWLASQEKFDLEKLRAEITAEAVKDLKDPSALQDASEIQAARITFRALRAI